jgi:hypothetical protein
MKLLALSPAFTGRAAAAWGRCLGGADAELVVATMTQHNADQLVQVRRQLKAAR